MPSAECFDIALLAFKAVPVFLFRGRKAKEGNDFSHALADNDNVLKSYSCREQYSHEPCVAVVRFQVKYLGRPFAEIEPRLVERSHAALARLDGALAGGGFLVGEALSLADIALVAYSRMAGDGGLSLAAYPALTAWIGRVEQALGIGPYAP